MDPQIPFEPLVPTPPPSTAPAPASESPPATASATRLTGMRRGMATFGLALGLLVVGGAAVVMAASPEPSSSAAPGTTPSTQPSTTDDDSTSAGRADHEDCPEDADGQDGRRTDGQDPAASPSTESPATTPAT